MGGIEAVTEGYLDQRIGFTGQITRFAARHPWQTLGLWVVLLVAAFGASTTMNLNPNTSAAGTESAEASALIEERLRLLRSGAAQGAEEQRRMFGIEFLEEQSTQFLDGATVQLEHRDELATGVEESL